MIDPGKLLVEEVTINNEDISISGIGNGESYEHPQTMLSFNKISFKNLLLKKENEANTMKTLAVHMNGTFREYDVEITTVAGNKIFCYY